MSGAAQTPWLVASTRKHADADAVVFEGRRTSWADLAALADSLAAGLHRLGIGRGAIVAVRMAPHPREVAMLHALQMLGAAMLPIHTRLARPEIERILVHAAPRLFVDETGSSDWSVPGMRVLGSLDDVEKSAGKSFSPPACIDPEAVLTVVCTSGTTGAPKAVQLSNANYAAGAAASRSRLGHGAKDAWLATLPLFHVGGLAILARAALEGSTVLLEAGFDIDRTVDVLTRGDATMISLVPTMLGRVLDRLDAPVSPRVRCVLVGGAALAASLAARALAAGIPIAATYGMTEACSQIATTTPGSSDAADGLVGKPLDGIEMRIDSADAEGWGEIRVRGPSVTRGYFRNIEADAAAFRDGWLATGDIGRSDVQGRLELAGRLDDLIVTGGENVSPLEVERVLDEHPAIAESMVVGLADETWGNRIVALVVARDQAHAPDMDEIVRWCRARIAAYKIPKELRIVGELPRGATGKLLRKVTRS